MTRIRNTKGVALVTSLMLTLISLTIIMALMYMITQSTQVSGASKRYKTALDAGYGGSELFTKDILPFLLENFENTNVATDLNTAYSTTNSQLLVSLNCLQSKLTLPSSMWPSGCSNIAEPKKDADLTFQLSATAGAPYTIYSKIIETMLGNTDMSGLQLEGAGVAEAQSGITPQHFPYMYRLEVQGERSTGATEQANIEVLYAY
jgi:hypothetical protein